MLCLVIMATAADWPGVQWDTARPGDFGLDATKLEQARDYALTGGGSGLIIHRGKAILSWGDQAALYDLKSSSKSIGCMLLGIALKDGKVKLDGLAKQHHPTFGLPPEDNAKTGWLDKITLRMLADQTAGFDKPGGFTNVLFTPGTQWSYSDGGPNWLAECLTLAYRQDLNTLIFARVFKPLGIQPADIRWRKNAFRPAMIDGIPRREFGSGFSANVNAMARIGYLHLRDGWWAGEPILPREFIQAIRHPDPALAKLPVRLPADYGKASAHYGLLWWNNFDGTIPGFPKDAHWSWGLYDSLIVVVPSLDLVIARAGKGWARKKDADHYEVLKPFFEPIAAAFKKTTERQAGAQTGTPYPPSPVIREIRWAPANTVMRLAKGSDNWPLTWADDDTLYTAYGDGNGFAPFVAAKLSLGLARVTGTPPKFVGENIRSASLEKTGDGRNGPKASGLLCVDGVLYLWARNLTNSQLAWSSDHGKNWAWAGWKFTESFGCPTFLNFGRDNAGARDGFDYLYSPDANSAYERADRMVLARAPKDRLRERATYEFFVKTDIQGKPVWSPDIGQRGAVFADPGNCYRSGITYNAGLKRYLWCQIGPGNDTRFAGGLAIYDAPEPWGPWTTAYSAENWDIGPGETASLPAKWISADGRTMHLVFSGDDCFSVRQATVVLRAKADALPDLSSVSPDLKTPQMENGEVLAGRRVRAVTTGWEKTGVYHALYLPRDWQPNQSFPVIVEYPGNGGYRNEYGDVCTGLPEGCNLGYGASGGEGFIWVCLPFVDKSPGRLEPALKWWGDVEETKRYCFATVREVCARYGGDPQKVVLAGFSRGAIAANYIGLHDDEIARLWRAFICHSHYDGVRQWGYAGDDRAAAMIRLRRLGNRPQWISHEGNVAEIESYLRAAKATAPFNLVALPYRNHSDQWVLRDLAERRRLREWLKQNTTDVRPK